MSSFQLKSNHSLVALLPIALLLTALISPPAQAYTLFETASLGPTGIDTGGMEISFVQSIGARFQVTSAATTTRVGAHLFDTTFEYVGNRQVYAAIVALSGPTDVPDSTILITPDVLGATLLTMPEISAEVSAPLSVSLEPGWYSLEIGSWQFGASGWGVLTRNNIDIGRPSFYRRLGSQYFDGGLSNVRLFVEAVPEPSGILLILSGLTTYAFLGRRVAFK